jgi:hypothetical protein
MRIPKPIWEDLNLPMPRGINPWVAWGTVGKNFCVTNTARELCAQEQGGDCRVCIPYLQHVFKELDKPGVNKPWGLFIWLLRDAAARLVDDSKKLPDHKNEWGEAGAGDDPFGALLEEL